MGKRRTTQKPLLISETLISELRECLAQRNIERGFLALRSQSALIDDLDPRQANAARFVGHLAQWIDVGAYDSSTLKRILDRFDKRIRAKLTFKDFLYLRMADGMLAMSHEQIEPALRHFSFVLEFPEELHDAHSTSIVNFWKARCLRRRGEYDEALRFAHLGRDTALALGLPKMAALSQVLESWILFQKGRLRDAEQISRHAESVLGQTDDYVTMGNLYSFYGRVARRAGRYDKAIEHFTQAINEYRKRDTQHPNLARSLANIALAKREIALQLRRKIDTRAEKRRQHNRDSAKVDSSGALYRMKLRQLHREIMQHLDEASSIYSHHPNHHGIGTVQMNYSYVLLDDGDYHNAEARAKEAFRLGESIQDYILMGRARIVQCMIDNARVEEEISEGSDPGAHARRAMEHIREAIDFAKHTQNQRLLTNAYLWLGFTCCNDFFDDPDAAREAYDLAIASRTGVQAENMAEDLQRLKSKIVRGGAIDFKFKAWSQGGLGDKTFQQLTEEFADLIIPQVWEREGRKVSRVAARLSISPKKVRRILDRVGRRKSK
jgi:tetratricopeptide (TPR) repeat protein